MIPTVLPTNWKDLMDRYLPETVETPAGSITCRRAGSGPDVVLLHGIGSGSGSWIYQLGGLADRFCMTAWDAPGYGGSHDPPGAAPQDYCNALSALLAALNIQHCILVGHSLGALMAGYFAAGNSTAITGLVLANPAAGHALLPEGQARQKMQARVERFDELGPRDHARARAPALLSPRATDDQRALVETNMALLRGTGYQAAAQLLSCGDLDAQLPRIACPALVLSGSADTITPPDTARRLADAFDPPAPCVEIAGAGHASPIEAPEVFNKHLSGFLEARS